MDAFCCSWNCAHAWFSASNTRCAMYTCSGVPSLFLSGCTFYTSPAALTAHEHRLAVTRLHVLRRQQLTHQNRLEIGTLPQHRVHLLLTLPPRENRRQQGSDVLLLARNVTRRITAEGERNLTSLSILMSLRFTCLILFFMKTEGVHSNGASSTTTEGLWTGIGKGSHLSVHTSFTGSSLCCCWVAPLHVTGGNHTCFKKSIGLSGSKDGSG